MALRGNRGKITFATNAVARVTQWSVEESGDSIDATVMDPTAADGPIPKLNIAGNTSWQMTCTCDVDRADTLGQQAMRAGALAAVKLYPESDGVGKKYWSGDAIVTRMQEQGEVNGKLTYTATLQGTGPLSFATA